jgi:hypothetical protein
LAEFIIWIESCGSTISEINWYGKPVVATVNDSVSDLASCNGFTEVASKIG